MPEQLTTQQIAARLTAIHAALVDKTGGQPYMPPMLFVQQSGNVSINLYGPYCVGPNEPIARIITETIESALDAADAAIATMPDADETQKRNWHKSLAKVIDEGESINIPNDVMTPLRDGMKAMSENLLTYGGAA